ncbi:unnamed protein product [Spirodela intermedia]|uniref:Kinesin motor domain-containing protein n=1 Tax=Spirodela intermedia TaxID=51605 RepID=A0A7I8I911_SPIIN|nr:unnamed protein product [Spirodela intermedia]CAA6653923.1 unnamed protein product [Spirodela intermedia]
MASLRGAVWKARSPEGNENDSDGVPDDFTLPPPREPLLSIPDPSQSPRGAPPGELEVPKADTIQLLTKWNGGTPRSAQSTPTKSTPRPHCGNGGLCSGNGGRFPPHSGARERWGSSKAARTMVEFKTCPSAEVRHFELDEDTSFWNDHNVQVLIRIRPINSTESALQGNGRCLTQESSHTLKWTGHPETRFTFDHVACETTSQETLFNVVGLPMVENCMSGYNSCMFAYGQTGSGKTYTMLGDNLCDDRGMTPRIFEYLFARIKEEEEERKNEKLKYVCKCSYLEIYNEQITDLLDPSSTNLQLREDMKKGVYVENLKEHDVSTVKDVIELLLQGTANRKMAATSMNSESSRSHSVFTCSIESQWEKDSMVHIRFGRLNLVDLAGSERQKSSGAEGERLKEAANINRSLSTLGLVIMTLVDIANGKQRHVPYRDSRLTFLLQDSLGGNSKTTIIANVSPSICSMNETLSTLKFAQRAKLIQNNAKVNEDASGDVMALQREIQRLRDQLNIVIEHQNIPRLPFGQAMINELTNAVKNRDTSDFSGDSMTSIEFLKAALADSMRREKTAEDRAKSLEAESEHMKLVVIFLVNFIILSYSANEMTLHLRDEAIQRLESLTYGCLSCDGYHMEKNNASIEQIQLLQEKTNRNPELTRLGQENAELFEQFRIYTCGKPCNFCSRKIGAFLNDQLEPLSSTRQSMDQDVSDFSPTWVNVAVNSVGDGMASFMRMDKIINHRYKDDVPQSGSTTMSLIHAKLENVQRELMEARRLNTQLQRENSSESCQSYEMERIGEQIEVEIAIMISNLHKELAVLQKEVSSQQATDFLDENPLTILTRENQELKERSCKATNAIAELKDIIDTKDARINVMAEEWEKAVIDLTSFLLDGCQSLEDASGQINSILDSFPHSKTWISDHVERAMKIFIEKERLIVDLKKNLEEAQKMSLEMTSKLNTLRGAMLAMTEVHEFEHNETTKEVLYLQAILNEKMLKIHELQDNVEYADDHIIKEGKQDDAAFMGIEKSNEMVNTKHARVNKLLVNGAEMDFPQYQPSQGKDCDPVSTKFQTSFGHNEKKQTEDLASGSKLLLSMESNGFVAEESQFDANVSLLKEIQAQVETSMLQTLDSDSELFTLFRDTQSYLSSLMSDINDTYSEAKYFFQQSIAELLHTKKHIIQLSMHNPVCIVGTSVLEDKRRSQSGPYSTIQLIKNNLSDANGKLRTLKVDVLDLLSMCRNTTEYENLTKKGSTIILDKEVNDGREFEDEQTEQTASLLGKFEEAHETMKEADLMLKKWKQTSEKMQIERDSLATEVERMREIIVADVEQEKFLRDQINAAIIEMPILMAAFQENFQTIEDYTISELNEMHSTVLSSLKEMHECIETSKAWLKSLSSEIIRKALPLSFPNLQHQGSLDEVASLELVHNLDDSSRGDSRTVPRDRGNGSLHVRNGLGSMKEDVEGIEQHEKGALSETEKTDIIGDLKFSEGHIVDLIEENDSVTHTLSLSQEPDQNDVLFRNEPYGHGLGSVALENVIKDSMKESTGSLGQAQYELAIKIAEVDAMLCRKREILSPVTDTKAALASSRSKSMESKDLSTAFLKEKSNLNGQLEKMDAERRLKDQERIIESLEKEICRELRLVCDERDRLQDDILHLTEKLEMARAMADENEAVAVEARQGAEASRIYAEEKEEEVRVLESSVAELEGTIDALEKKVFDMAEEVERYQLMREEQEQGLQTLRKRVLTRTPGESFGTDDSDVGAHHVPRQFEAMFLELYDSKKKIEDLEKERARQAEEIERFEEHISELILHSEAQSSHYHQKFQMLEAMVSEAKMNPSLSNHASSLTNKIDKTSVRPRGSVSPFKCISSVVQQMNSEKDKELSLAKLRIEELQALAANRQKQVCMLSARLAAVDNMTHDVIRDLLEVKLDMTSYANLIEMEQLKISPGDDRQEDHVNKEKTEGKINDLIEEKDRNEADILATQAKLEKLQHRYQVLTAQNEMLKMDKRNLTRRIAEQDEIMKQIVGPKSFQELIQSPPNDKESSPSSHRTNDLARRLAKSDKLLLHRTRTSKPDDEGSDRRRRPKREDYHPR